MLPQISVSIGTAAPVNLQDVGSYLTTGYNADGDVDFTLRSSLEGSGSFARKFGFNKPPTPYIDSPAGKPLRWTAVSNQFFTSILSPEPAAKTLTTRRVKLDQKAADNVSNAYGIVGIARFDLPPVQPEKPTVLAASFYAGPKEYTRLAKNDNFKADESKVMQFGMFKWFSQILLWLMTWFHGVFPNWGVAIIFTTLTLKIIFMYPTMMAQKSAKRMQKLQGKFQPEFKALREKYKDNPRKLNTETMELYKKHGINPASGCAAMLPILLSMPFFMGFFSMLSTTAELRFAPFLWTPDLSAQDTIAVIPGLNFPINILPLLMGATMFIQMRLTPMPPTMDPAQAAVFKFMPWMFLLICYSFSAALSLYSTINGIFTIGQQILVNRMPDDPEPPPGALAAKPAPTKPGGKPVKNVTPGNKRA